VLWQKFWRIIFGVDLLGYLLIWLIPATTKQERYLVREIYVGLVLGLPYYSGMFIYAFRSKAIWHPGEVDQKIKNILTKIYDLLSDGNETHQNYPELQHALNGTEEEFLGFLVSDDLWGGPGSIVDQALIEDEEARRELEKLMFQLGRIQVKKNIVNIRTEMWTIAFKERRNMSF
jgi:hypothetical protein